MSPDHRDRVDALRDAVDYHLPPHDPNAEFAEEPNVDLNTAIWALERLRLLLDILDEEPSKYVRARVNEELRHKAEEDGWTV